MNLSKMQELLLNEVVTTGFGCHINNRPTSQISEIRQTISDRFGGDLKILLSEEGLLCQVLRLGSPKWKSGRLRLMLLFEPDEPVKENSSEKDELDESLSELQRLADS